jgi:hypothetical protein
VTELNALKNPFRDNVVQDAWQAPPDVAAIHSEVFQACLEGIDSASRGIPDSLLIYGSAGSGKTHLLTRLQRHLAETAAAAPDRVLRCVFVFVRLQTSPLLLWQHVRKRFASDLMRRDQGVTQLQRLVAHQLSLSAGDSPRLRVMELRVLSADNAEPLIKHLASVAESLQLPRDLRVVLEHLICNRFVRDASAWLSGESLPDDVLAQLGVGPGATEDREESARDIVTALGRLAGETLPIVFCFDQVEALQRGLDDRDAFFRFSRLAADLVDADANVFLITCLQSALSDQFSNSVRQADRDRMAKREIALPPLTKEQVESLVAARLSQLPELAGPKGQRFHPLTDAFVRELALDQPCVPRRVLSNAARAFEEIQHGRMLPRPPTAKFLREEFDEHHAEVIKGLKPDDTTSVLMAGLETMSAISGGTVQDGGQNGPDFFIERERKVAVEIRNEADGRSLVPRLKRLVATTPRLDGAATVILRDPRLQISKNAQKTREYLAILSERGVPLITPTVEATSAIAALSQILATAKSGDLANDGNPVPDSAVLDWLRSLHADLLIEPVEELVQTLMTEKKDPVDPLEADLAELLSTERVLELEAIADKLRSPADKILAVVRKRTDRFLLLDGLPEVVVDVAGILPSADEEVAQ